VLDFIFKNKSERKIERLNHLLRLIGIDQSIVLLEGTEDLNDPLIQAQLEEQIKLVYRPIESLQLLITISDTRQAIENDKSFNKLIKNLFKKILKKIKKILGEQDLDKLISIQLPVIERQKLRGNIIQLLNYFETAIIHPEIIESEDYHGCIIALVDVLNLYQYITVDRRLRPILENSEPNISLYSKLNNLFVLISKEGNHHGTE
jgi:hypothetical protein